MLYVLGLSYEATSLALEALGVYMGKSSVYEAVQAAAKKVPGLKRNQVFGRLRTPVLGGDLTSVKCDGEWLSLGWTVDDTTGLVLTVDDLSAEDAETLKERLQQDAGTMAPSQELEAHARRECDIWNLPFVWTCGIIAGVLLPKKGLTRPAT